MRYLNTAVQNLADAEDRRQVPVVAHAFSEISEGPGREVACYIREDYIREDALSNRSFQGQPSFNSRHVNRQPLPNDCQRAYNSAKETSRD